MGTQYVTENYQLLEIVTKRETLNLMSDFPDCQVAARMLISDTVNEVNNMRGALKKCETELENLKKDNGESTLAEMDERIRE